jgi:hypothetical protein
LTVDGWLWFPSFFVFVSILIDPVNVFSLTNVNTAKVGNR